MHNRYDTLFSLEILHAKFPPPSAGAAMPVVPDFGFEPTAATRQLMRQNGIGLKSGPGRCTVFIEKSAKPDGSFVARSKTAASMALNFFLRQTNGALIAATKPFSLPAGQLPAFSGRKRVLYFNNTKEFARPGDVFWLTDGAVGAASFASAAPDIFDFKTKNGSVTGVEAKAFAPGSKAVPFDAGAAQTAAMSLPENGYQVVQKPGSDPPETLFFSPDALPEGTVGVVQLFPFQAGSSPPPRRYQIFFE